jgi:TetR/AcrR family tetracycline transcriptional repressor
MPLSRQQVVDEAVRLVDEHGLDGLSLRALAARLGVQAPTLYWHVRDKSALIDAIADAIMDDALASVPDSSPAQDWREWLVDAVSALRRAMLDHRDGARIVSGARTSLRRGDFSELAMSTLVDRGVPLQQARLTVLAAERYTVGHVLEEQGPQPGPDEPTPDVGELQRRFPTVVEAVTEYFASGRTVDDLFIDGARQVVGLAGGD